MNFSKIPFIKDAQKFTLIEEGYSTDQKWCVDNKYLLRISPGADIQYLEHQAVLTNKIHALDKRVPKVHEVGQFNEHPFVLLDYLPGENGEVVLPKLDRNVQYKIGCEVGTTLKNIHGITAPSDHPSWEDRWVGKMESLTPRFKSIVERHPEYSSILPFIQENLYLLKNRPSCIQHYDFHPGNILIENDQFTGLIDMQKITYADPINEFYKMEYFNVQVSQSYAKGVLDGYHEHAEIPVYFWELHRLYAAIHIVSAEVWGHEGGMDQKDKFQGYSRFTINQFDNFKLLIPKWYTS